MSSAASRPTLSPSGKHIVCAPVSPWIRRGASGIHGRGVYARKLIPAETRIVQYAGERITKAESLLREELRAQRARRGGDGSVYIFALNKRYDLDGRVHGNISRLINHSCAPNCRAVSVRGKIWITSNVEIPTGHELTIDYGYSFADWQEHPCRCGTEDCVGFIVNEAQRWRVRRILEARVGSGKITI